MIIRRFMTTKKTVIGKDVPDLISDHCKVRAEIKATKDMYAGISSPANLADAAVNNARDSAKEWKSNTPGKLEDYKRGSTDYRGQGLLPSDKTDGIRVADKK
jgi:hypothetical protein